MGKSQVSIRVNDVLFSAFGVAGSAHFLELVFVREDTIFRFAAFGYPTAMGDVEFDDHIKGGTVGACLAA
jgi:hypothetical protein